MGHYLVEITHSPSNQHVEYIEVDARNEVFACIAANHEFNHNCSFMPKKRRDLLLAGTPFNECRATAWVELEHQP